MSTMTLKELLDEILDKFSASGITQQELAKLSGVHFVTINRILRQNQTPSFDVCEKLANALDMEVRVVPIVRGKKLPKKVG